MGAPLDNSPLRHPLFDFSGASGEEKADDDLRKP
jgi:hypothetical protein